MRCGEDGREHFTFGISAILYIRISFRRINSGECGPESFILQRWTTLPFAEQRSRRMSHELAICCDEQMFLCARWIQIGVLYIASPKE